MRDDFRSTHLPAARPSGEPAHHNTGGALRYRAAPPADGSQFHEILDLLYRSRWIILASVAAVMALAAARLFTLEPEYEAYSLVLVDASSSPSQERSGFNLTGAEQSDQNLATEMVILRQSLPLVVAERLLSSAAPDTVAGPLTALEDRDSLTAEDLAERLQDSYVEVSAEGENVNVIRITATSSVPQEGAFLANAFAEEFVRRTQEKSRARASTSRAFLEEQAQKRKEELSDIEERLQAYMKRESAVALDQEAQGAVSRIAEMEAERDRVQVDLEMKEGLLRSLEEELADLTPKLAQRAASSVEQEITEAQKEIVALESYVEEIYQRNPGLRGQPTGNEDLQQVRLRIRQLRARTDSLSRQYANEVMAVGGIDPTGQDNGLALISDLRRRIVDERVAADGLEAKASKLSERLGRYNAKLQDLPAQFIELAQLRRAQESTERVYLALVDKLQEARVAEEAELGYAEVIRPAFVPGAPTSPNPARDLALSLFAGLLLGLGLAVARRKLDHRIYDPEALRVRGHHVIGTVPNMRSVIEHDFQGESRVMQDGMSLSTRLVPQVAPTSPIAESYREVRTNIQFGRTSGAVQTLLVTGPRPNEGKSVTAANLAIVMAQAKRRTLLVDADLRRPSIHKKLGLSSDLDLVEVLRGEAPPPTPEQMQTGIENLHVLPSTTTVADPSELLGSEAMRRLLEKLRERFDVILFDAPPVLVATDAVVLSTLCDATLLVTMAGRTDEAELERCREALDEVDSVVIGTVLNGSNPSTTPSYRYGHDYAREPHDD